MNNNYNRQFSVLDILNILSFLISIENLNANLNQNDKADLQHDLSQAMSKILEEIHGHLEKQDEKINYIMSKLEEKHDS